MQQRYKQLWLACLIALVLLAQIGFAADFVGSEACKNCHLDKYNSWIESGHPYKFSIVENNEAPTYPDFVTNFQDQWIGNLGDGSHTWADVAGVIGGFGWKARFVGTDGVIIGTASSQFADAGGGHNQFNFYGGEAHGWVDYDKDTENKIYNYACFKCHTTGGTTEGTWLDGVDGLGTFIEGGVGCEACHGPGSDHIAAPDDNNIDKVYEFAHLDNASGGLTLNGELITPNPNGNDVNFLCGTCHNRSYTDPINSKGGFIRHHEQWDEMMSQKHGELGFTCVTCHDPHKRVIWDGDGITKTCESCHADKAAKINHLGTATCIDCHMPFAAKSGTTRGQSGYKGDIRSHIVAITPNTESMFTEDGANVRDDETRSASLSPAYSCLGCHNDDPDDAIPDMSLQAAANIAKGMHSDPTGEAQYVGSETCGSCHSEKYMDWKASGHPYKFSIIENETAPTYPEFVMNFQDDWIGNLGDGSHTWADIAGVIGGFGWKVRFVGTDGVIIGTASSQFADAGGGHNQFNFYGGEAHGWVDYDKDTENKSYNYGCFKCHTTGGTTEGTWLEGVDGLGTFTEGGVGCESCHGPGSLHVQSGGSKDKIDRVYEFAHLDNTSGGLTLNGEVITPNPEGDDVNFLCGTCHNRSYTDPINSKGGFIRHHEQWDEFVASRHGELGFTCTTCHDPHKRVLWDGDGITKKCETCHSDKAGLINHVGNATCIDCHMPFAAKSGTTRGQSGYKADVRSHLFAITPNTESMFTEDGSNVRDDDTRKASLSPGFSCLGCHNDDPDDDIPDMTLDAAAAIAKGMHSESAKAQYVGSETCGNCHTEKYNDWKNSGHPYKFSIVENEMAPTYPDFVTNFQDDWIGNLGDGSHTWADVAGVIGGFGWKARFVGTDGVIIGTASSQFADAGGGHNQFNFYGGEAHGWVDYDKDTENKSYNYGCFKCHTTGGDTTGTWLEGVDGLGTFTEGGVGCESCHGPGSLHAQTADKSKIDRVYEFAHLDNAIGGLELDGKVITPDPEGDDVNFLCGTCHNRSYTDPINSKGGFIRHHEQWDEFMATKHGSLGFTCITCHDPHKRVLWDGDGITKKCETCHSDKVDMINHAGDATCIDCHMPFAAKSGTTRGQSGYKADVRSHLVAITADTSSMFTEDGSAVRDDEQRHASLSPAYSCLGCHNDSPDDDIPDKTLEEVAMYAAGMHTPTGVAHDISAQPVDYALAQNTPNPFNPSTMITFNLREDCKVELKVYTALGTEVTTLINKQMTSGQHRIQFRGDNLPSGVYIYTIRADEFTASRKMLLIK